MPRSALSVLGAVVLTATVSVAPVIAVPQDTTPAPQSASTTAPAAITVERLAGKNRFGTAAEIAKQWSAPVDHVYVVSADNFYDVLIAAARAGVHDAPVLLIQRDRVPSATAQQLARLMPTTITAVGSSRSSITDRVMTQLDQYVGSGGTNRVAATDRYTRSALMAERYSASPDRVYLVSGEDYPDALSAAALAGTRHEPLMLTKRSSLSPEVRAQLSRLQPREVVVVGGTSAVSNAVLNTAASYATSGKAIRLSGSDRYQTAAAVAREFPNTVDTAYLASGQSHADALVISALAAREQSAVVLTPSQRAAQGTLDAVNRLTPSTLTVAGGESAVSDQAIDDIRGARPPAPKPPVDPEPPAPEPPVDPEPPTPEPPSGEFPDEDSTGVPDGVTLTPTGGMTITQDGTVVDSRHVSGRIVIEADNVTVRNTLVQSGTSMYPIHVTSGTTGTLIENVEIDNQDGTGIGIFVQGSGTIRGANIHSAEDGVRLQADDVTIEDSYIHDLHRQSGGHHDSIQIRRGDNVTIQGNNLQPYVASTGDPMNAALQIGSLQGNDSISNLKVVGNLMNGGNFTINGGRSGDTDSVLYAHNEFGRDYRYGVVGNLQSGSVWEDTNVWHDTGEPVR